MEEVYVIRGIFAHVNGRNTWMGDFVYSGRDKALRAAEKANENMGWFDRLIGARWEVHTLNVIN